MGYMTGDKDVPMVGNEAYRARCAALIEAARNLTPADAAELRHMRQTLRLLRSLEMEANLHNIAFTAAFDSDRIAASVKLHAISDGLPVARVLNANMDVPTPDEMPDDPIAAAELYQKLITG